MLKYRELEKIQKTERANLSRRQLQFYVELMQIWGLSRSDSFQLLALNRLFMISKWQRSWEEIILTDEQLERLGYLLSIHHILEAHFGGEVEQLREWLHVKQTTAFSGLTPVEALKKASNREVRYIAKDMMDHWDCYT